MSLRRRRRRVTQDDLGRELEYIRNAHDGKLRPVDVVNAARSEDHPLHGCFTWDDGRAAELYRIHEARNLIRDVTVEIGERTVTKYWNVPATKPSESFYQPADIIIERPDEFQRALQLLSEKLESAKRSLEELNQLATRSKDYADRLAFISLAVQAFSAAQAAVERIQ